MTDPTTTLVKPLDPWQEESLEVEDKDEQHEKIPRSELESFFDQSANVAKQADEYWRDHVLSRSFEGDEAHFNFNNHTYAERKKRLGEIDQEQTKLEDLIGATTDDTEKDQLRRKLIAKREERAKVIMEQAWADLAYLLDHRAKLEAQIKELAVNAETQDDIDKLKELAATAKQLTSRLIKFELYTEAAIVLFREYFIARNDLSAGTGDGKTDRFNDFMFKMLVETEKATGANFGTTDAGDRNQLNMFVDLREKVVSVDYKKLENLIKARVSQLEAEKTNQVTAQSATDQQSDSQTEGATVDSQPVTQQPDDAIAIDPEDMTDEESNASRSHNVNKLQQAFSGQAPNPDRLAHKDGHQTEKPKKRLERGATIKEQIANIFHGSREKPHAT